MKSFLRVARTILILSSFFADHAFAADTFSDATRENLQEDYIHLRQNNPSPFSTAPVTHVVPSRDTFTVGLSTDVYNTLVVPRGQSATDNPKEKLHKLEVTGSSIAPLFVVSSKAYALGVAGETGNRQSHYLQDYRATGNGFQEQTSSMSYSGAGLYFYLLVPQKALPSAVKFTLLLGSVRMTAVHENNGIRADEFSEAYRTYSYPVSRTQAGANIVLRLNRRFSIVFWYNYLTHKTGDATVLEADPGAEKSEIGPQGDTYDQVLKSDQELFWQAQPRHRLGVDLALHAGGLEVHLGGLLGYVAARGTTPENIADNNIFVSFAYSTGYR